jgi:hypothetical protein
LMMLWSLIRQLEDECIVITIKISDRCRQVVHIASPVKEVVTWSKYKRNALKASNLTRNASEWRNWRSEPLGTNGIWRGSHNLCSINKWSYARLCPLSWQMSRTPRHNQHLKTGKELALCHFCLEEEPEQEYEETMQLRHNSDYVWGTV